MNMNSKESLEVTLKFLTSRSSRPGRRLRGACSALLLGVGLVVANGTQAQVAVYDGPNWFENMWSKIQASYSRLEATAEYASNKLRWAEQLQRYTDALVKIQGQINSFGLPAGAPLVPVADDYMVAETCGGADFSMGGLFSTFVLKTGEAGNWKAQQKQICVNIRTMRNRKFNESLEFAGGTMQQMQKALDSLTALRNASNLLGNVSAVDSDSLRTANDISVKTQQWEARMKSYDAYIEVMEENQRIVAKMALKGDPTKKMMGDVLKTTVLAGVLKVD